MTFKLISGLDSNAYRLLLQTYVATGRTSHEIQKRMKEDDIEMDSELGDLLRSVCPRIDQRPINGYTSKTKLLEFFHLVNLQSTQFIVP